jgi:proteasome lid subunit RPN8/RPN11
VIDQILAHAAECQPLECCGLIVRVGDGEQYRRCRNLSTDAGRFEIHGVDLAAAEDAGEILKIVHSHVNQPAAPTPADRVGCEQTGLPWLIVSWPNGDTTEIEPSGYQAELIGREFVWGVFDCFALVRDYYAQTLGLLIPEFGGYQYSDSNLYQHRFEEAGFRRMPLSETPQPHDVLMLSIGASAPRTDAWNHAAIYLGDELMLHHPLRRLSGRAPWQGYWRDSTRAILRHESLCA